MIITDEVQMPIHDDEKALRLQYVPRWTIVSMDRQQSVAEHSYNVTMIVRAIMINAKESPTDRMIVMNMALKHDIPEHCTGDIPSPAKVKEPRHPHPHNRLVSWLKLADLIEALRYANRHCNDTEEIKYWILYEHRKAIKELLTVLGLQWVDVSYLFEVSE